MSYTELYAFDKTGKAKLFGTVHNAWRGAMRVWRIMEERYLPLYIPDFVKCSWWYYPEMDENEIIKKLGLKPSRLSDSKSTEEIWELADNKDVPINERVVMYTTFDGALVKRENFSEVIKAFREFVGETSLPEQADILEKMFAQNDIIAAGWNQTSVNLDTWENIGGYDESAGKYIPYNCLTGNQHFWVFDKLKAEKKRAERGK